MSNKTHHNVSEKTVYSCGGITVNCITWHQLHDGFHGNVSLPLKDCVSTGIGCQVLFNDAIIFGDEPIAVSEEIVNSPEKQRMLWKARVQSIFNERLDEALAIYSSVDIEDEEIKDVVASLEKLHWQRKVNKDIENCYKLAPEMTLMPNEEVVMLSVQSDFLSRFC